MYYRVFTNDIGITSIQPASVSNPYLGRVGRNSIAPPQEVLQFKRRLCKVEDIRDFASSTLYPSASNQSPMGDGDRVPDALGSTLDNPMELVASDYTLQVQIVVASPSPMTQRIGHAYPQPQYSTRSPSVSSNLLILFQFIIPSTQKMGPFSRRRLSKLMTMVPRPSLASTRT